MKAYLAAWFGLKAPVSRGAYVAGGVLFMVLKFVLERELVMAWLGRELTPVAFLSPFFVDRIDILSHAPDGATWAMIALALPFLWLGISMSVRRALDAGIPPLVGFLFLIPGVNYLLMLALSILPTKAPKDRNPAGSAYRPPPEQTELPKEVPSAALRATRAVIASACVGFAMFGVSVYLLHSYGVALFVSTPFTMGMVAAMAYKAARAESPMYRANAVAVGCGIIGLGIVGLGLLFSAKEGLGCLAMALIPAGIASLAGSVLGIAVGSFFELAKRRSAVVLLALPLAAGAESQMQRAPAYEVVSTVEVDAPPEVVWHNVTSFPDLEPPTEWMFRHGISYPLRARIDGEGVGAVRTCEFSTGSFVEPITRWDAPRVLSFDVADSPPPMREWSFWDHVDAPHLHGFMRSRRGEFRLTRLPGGRTRLEGSTWYELEIYPSLYWKAVTDQIVHTIHTRVLDHIRRISEDEAARVR